MCHLKHQLALIQNKNSKREITQQDYQIYNMLMKNDYRTVQKATGLSRSTLYRLKKRIQKQ